MRYSKQLEQLASTGSMREFRPLAGKDMARVSYQGRSMLNLTSNDYLGIAANKQIHKDYYTLMGEDNIIEEYGLGAASSRLLTGDSPRLHALERDICAAYQRPACLLFNSGYHANIGILPALAGKKDLILSDKLNHASIHDCLRLSRADYKRFRHLDYEHLEDLLVKNRNSYENVFIVTESVFSMDGDEADLEELVELKSKYNCLLYLDEAHAVGVFGRRGLGKVEEKGFIEDVDLIVGTFGKAFASIGAYVVCDEDIYSYLVNSSRSLIFTTALPPVVNNWNHFIFHRILEMDNQRQLLQSLSSRLRQNLIEKGLKTAGSTNIVPVIIGDNQMSVELAEKMRDAGYLIFAIRPPTVPEGTSRFRLSVTAAMEWADLAPLAELIAGLD